MSKDKRTVWEAIFDLPHDKHEVKASTFSYDPTPFKPKTLTAVITTHTCKCGNHWKVFDGFFLVSNERTVNLGIQTIKTKVNRAPNQPIDTTESIGLEHSECINCYAVEATKTAHVFINTRREENEENELT